MSQIITPVVVLPRMNAADAITIALALKTALRTAQTDAKPNEEAAANAKGKRREADAKSAPAPVIAANVPSCMTRLETCCEALSSANRKGSTTPVVTRSGTSTKSLLGGYKRAWSAVRSQVNVWRETGTIARLSEEQRDAVDQTFPAGGDAQKLTGAARRVWVWGRDTLASIKSHGLDEAFASLGAQDVLAHVQKLHTQLAASLGVTVVSRSSSTSGGDVGGALADVQATLREYVIKVHAMVDPAVPGSAELAETLLKPLSSFQPTVRSSPAKATPKTVPAKPAPIDTTATASNTNATTPALRPTGTG